MPRINEHKFIFENIDYKLTFFPKESAIVYINEKIYTGNRTVLLKKYIAYLGLDTKLDGLTPQQLSSIVLNHFSELNNKGFKKTYQKLESNKNNKPNSSSITNYTNQIEIENLNLSKNFKVVMVCASGKNKSFFTAYPNENFVNIPGVGVVNEHHPDDPINNMEILWRDYLINNQIDNNLLEAYNLYTREEYRCLHRKYEHNFYILSAGWGLVNSEFKLPKYDITFSSIANPANKRNYNLIGAPVHNDFNQLNLDGEEDIVYIGSPDYIPLFFDLTGNLKNRKIIYWKGMTPQPVPVRFPIPNNTFSYRYYITNTRMNWYYEVARDFCNGIIP